MSKRTFRRTAKVLHRWCEDIHSKQPDECVTVYFNGPWILKIRDLVSWLVRHREFEGLDGREEDFEWRLYRGAY